MLQVPATTYTAPITITANNMIDVTGNQTNTSPNSGVVNMIAGNLIRVANEVVFSGEFDLYINTSLDYFAACSGQYVPPITGSALTNFCQNSGNYSANGYLGNTYRPMSPPPDGTNTVQSLPETDVKSDMISIYPNPSSGLLNMEYYSNNDKEVQIIVMDITGKIILSQKLNVENGFNPEVIDLQRLENGMYMLQIINKEGGLIKTEKIVLNK
jgi:hypothetical protein